MKSNIVVSIVMAVYNGEKYLSKTIDSVLNQSFKDFEFIIINDGSRDETEGIILSYSDDRIVYVKNDTNLKLVGSLNKGIKLAKGEFIARIDADDIMYSQRLEEQVRFFRSHNDVGVLGSSIDIIDEEGLLVSKWNFPSSDKELKEMLLNKNPISHPAVMYRKSLVINEEYPYNPKYPSCEDYELWIRLHKTTQFYSFEESLTQYRRHNEQITDKKVKSVQTDVFRLIINSVFSGRISYKALVYLYKPMFYMIAPLWVIKYQMNRVKETNIT